MYKRQSQPNNKTNPSTVTVSTLPKYSTSITVSYTHLDVYKRQIKPNSTAIALQEYKDVGINKSTRGRNDGMYEEEYGIIEGRLPIEE